MKSKSSIRVMLCGGLGNQLFQYACGRALALQGHRELVLDSATLFAKDIKYGRNYELDLFNLPADIRVVSARDSMFGAKLRFSNLCGELIGINCMNIIAEGDVSSFAAIVKQHSTVPSAYLYGYWQSEKYFMQYADQIRTELIAKIEIPPSLEAKCADLSSTNSVAVHVRRQQYAQQLPVGYYKLAILEMRQRLERPKFYILTDDPDWCHNSDFIAEDVIILSEPNQPSHFDFITMLHCRHFIIANSSFSWWAAWLSPHADKVVSVPPSQWWFNQDSICDDWSVVAF